MHTHLYRAQMRTATQEHTYTRRGTLTLCSSRDAMQPFGSTHCHLFALEELWPQKGQTRQGFTESPLPQQRPPQVAVGTAQGGIENAGSRVGPCSCPVPDGGSRKGWPHLPFLSSFSICPGQVLGSKLSPRTEALCSPLLLQSTPAPSWRGDCVSYRAPCSLGLPQGPRSPLSGSLQAHSLQPPAAPDSLLSS